MNLKFKLILTLLVTVQSTFAAVNDRCTGRTGICIATSTCSNFGGDNFSGKCPDDADNIKCCDNIPCQANDGRKGKCVFNDQCDGDQISGKCPGGNDFKCCVPKYNQTSNYIGTTCSYDGLSGTCQYDNKCKGFNVSGRCPGPTNIKCCFPMKTCTGNDGSSGSCLPTDQCETGYTESGKCPGGTTIKCCLPKPNLNPIGTDCTYDGLKGKCQYVNKCNDGFTVTGKCPGSSNIKCCIPKTTCSNGSSSGVCIPSDQCSTGNTVSNKCPGGNSIKCCLPDPINTPCTYEGLSGTCQYDNNCNGFNVSGKCPGASNIKCCLPKNTCSDGNQTGTCLPVDQCSTGNAVDNICQGTGNIKCCLPKPEPIPSTCSYEGLSGKCIDSSNCDLSSSFTVDNECPGTGANIKCCIPKQTCSDDNQTGSCIPSSQCSGRTVGKLCKGGNDILCCLPEKPEPSQTSCEYQGLKGVCKNANDCNSDSSTFTVDGQCPQFGGDIKCCLPRVECDDGEGECITEKQCSEDGGTSVSKKCLKYGNDIKCCKKDDNNNPTNPTTEVLCKYQGLTGICKNANECNSDSNTFTVDGQCPQFSGDIKCCLPREICDDGEGECVTEKQCREDGGYTESKKCMIFEDGIKCCKKGKSNNNPTNPTTETPCQYQALKGVCKNVNECNSDSSTFTVDGECPQFGNDIKCCLPRVTCDDGEGDCITEKQCSIDGGTSVSKKCMNFGYAIKCCKKGDIPIEGVGDPCKADDGTEGTCMVMDNCPSGLTVRRKCNGPDNVRCCLPETWSPPIGGGQGTYDEEAKCKPPTVTSNEKLIWDEFKKRINNDYGVAALMGNLWSESGLNPQNLQDSKEGPQTADCPNCVNMSDDEYTSQVDSNKYTSFASDDNAYGLAQWKEKSRKTALYNFAKNEKKTSIGDLNMQIEFLWQELNTLFNEPGISNDDDSYEVLPILKSATSVEYASKIVLTRFERLGGRYDTEVQKERLCKSNYYYYKYAKGYNKGNIPGASVAFSWETKKKGNDNNGTQLYRALIDEFCADKTYQSCDHNVAAAVKWSGADDSFPCQSTATQYDHMLKRTDLWEYKGKYVDFIKQIRPGDIIIYPKPSANVAGHVVLYVGNNEVIKKYPHQTTAAFTSASLNDRSPGCGDEEGSYNESKYHVFRYKGNYDGDLKNFDPGNRSAFHD